MSAAETRTDVPAISAEDITVTIAGRQILAGVGLTLNDGELVALIGPNGAGKSTLLAALTGDQDVSGGSILLRGRPLEQWRLRERARTRAVLLQDNAVFFPFPVRDVVEMGRAPWQRTGRETEDDAVVDEAMRVTEITHLASRRVPSLSGGERARTAFARILAQETGVLLLDEPTAALDLKHQEDVLGLAADRARAGDAVIVVLHDLNLAAAYADRILLMDAGRVVAEGAPSSVLTPERIEQVYHQAVDILPHPDDGTPVIVPRRGRPAHHAERPGTHTASPDAIPTPNESEKRP
ncbi:heme ABC transporter ATP-binding protein [Mycetocola reblochoni]|uniref:Heme ABC transporter, ATPase component HmuV n=2 Tax=Mycetocola reblochoni TaxID=331618 RepID=A0A1R4IQR2_9MICO|nr:heme ABC transporter ATP-binding protein [Mycetocola reblochoni]RLP69289.1 heme ABC transporter ATP-binding protein [Mycetocola reblochoni]SJN22221.1 Heme ABC transporter, ATPase component HmuV [Mycetocola reblochoni REB411]